MIEPRGRAALRSGDSPSAAAEAAVGPVPLVVAVVVRHYCCCVLEEEVLHVTHSVGIAVRAERLTGKTLLLFTNFHNFCNNKRPQRQK